MIDKLTTIETKRARQAKQFSPKLDIRALEAELRRENRNAISSTIHRRMDYGRMATNERSAK